MQTQQVTVSNHINNTTISLSESIQRIVEESTSTKAPRATSSARRMRAASIFAQKTVESQMEPINQVERFILDETTVLNPENAQLLIQEMDQFVAMIYGADFAAELAELDRMIDSTASPEEVISLYKELTDLGKLYLDMYLGKTDEVVAYLKDHQEVPSLEDDEEEDDLYVEGKAAHAVFSWVAENDMSQVVDFASQNDALSLLLLKAKGIALPETVELMDYEKMIHSANQRLSEENLSRFEQQSALFERAFSKAMLGDYEGALQDYAELEGLGLHLYDISLYTGVIHYLNNDQENARASLSLVGREETTIYKYFESMANSGQEIFPKFAIAKLLGL